MTSTTRRKTTLAVVAKASWRTTSSVRTTTSSRHGSGSNPYLGTDRDTVPGGADERKGQHHPRAYPMLLEEEPTALQDEVELAL